MVDPNPGRGMPLQLQRYWLGGKGAAKIKWGMPGDFNRCVRNLRKYFPTEPEGLCNILHTKALGAPPGKGHGDAHAITAATALLAAMPAMGEATWAGPIAPIGRPTGEPRMTRLFEPNALQHRMLPLPLAHRRVTAQGHEGAVTVGRVLGIAYGPDENGLDWAYAWGDWLDEGIVPEVREAKYLAAMGVAGPSVDPGGRVEAALNPETGVQHMMRYTIGGVTLVPIPAFTSMRLRVFDADEDWPDDDLDMVMEMDEGKGDCGCKGYSVDSDEPHTFAVNPGGWRGLPLAARASTFDNDDAVKRIAAWAGVQAGAADVEKLRRAFLWRNPSLPETDPTSYRLPVGDIINGKLTLIYHAIYAAAALISGAHGGLPNVPEEDKNELRNVITDIYDAMAADFNDSSVRAPWDRPENEGQQFTMNDSATQTGYPVAPPKAWFDDPELTGRTPLTVEPNGRVFGHIAAWNECHRDVTQRECVLAPHSKLAYRPFHLGQVHTAEGDVVRVGKIIQDTRHASINLGYTAAAIHYDNTGDEVAVVRAGEDEYGIWVAGAIVPEATPRKVAKLRRSPISGDWRAVEGNLELTAALAVNVPAFPVYAMDGEDRFALVAAGSLEPAPIEDEPDETVQALVDMFTAMAAADTVDAAEEAARQERAERLKELAEDEAIYSQRERAQRLAQLQFTAMTETPPAPTAAAPAPAASAAPAPAAPAPEGVQPAVAVEGQPTAEQEMLGRQMNARFSVVRRADGTTVAPADTSAAAKPAPVAAPATAPAAPPAAPAK